MRYFALLLSSVFAHLVLLLLFLLLLLLYSLSSNLNSVYVPNLARRHFRTVKYLENIWRD